MNTYLVITTSFVVSTLASILLVPYIIRWHKHKNLMVDDMNKQDKRKVPGLGGIALVLSFFFAIAISLVLKMIFHVEEIRLGILLPGFLSIIIMAFVGFTDDVLMFPIRPVKPILTLLASIPMMTIAYSQDTVFNLPFVGEINLYYIYPLLIIPFIMVFTSNAINIMADFDGLTPSNGTIISVALFICAYISNQPTAMLIFASLAGAQIVFWFFNKYPASVFTGNVGTLFLGSALAVGAIIGNLKYALFILLVPYILHFVLQQRIAWDRKSLTVRPRERGIISRSGLLRSEYKIAYGLTHLIMQRAKNITEKKLVGYLALIELVCALSATIIHFYNVK